MAFQLGSLGTIQKPELVSNNRARSGNYRDFLSNTKKKRMDFEDREKLNALGDARSEAILDSQGGSEVIQGLRKKQQDALANKDSAMYDQATNELKSQIQIESAEAKADPFGKNQLGRDKLAQSQKNKSLLSDPRVVELRKVQDNTKLEAQNLLSQAIATTDSAIRESLRGEYDKLLAQNWEADRQLTAFGLAEHHKNPMTAWVKALGGMAKQAGAESVANAMVKKIMADANVSEEKARDIVAKIEREKGADDRSKQSHQQRMAIGGESLLQAQEKTKSVKEGNAKEKQFAQFAKELIRLDKIISNASSADLWKKAVSFGTMPTVMSTALDNYTEAILREKSGAAIGIQEEASDKTRYTPSIIDSPEVVAEKARIRAGHINKIISQAGNAYKDGGYTSSFKSGGSGDATPTIERNKIFNPITNTFE
jgi:hypothetical protein